MNYVPLEKGKLNLIFFREKSAKSYLPCIIFLLRWLTIQTNGRGEDNPLLCLLEKGVHLLRLQLGLYTEKYAP